MDNDPPPSYNSVVTNSGGDVAQTRANEASHEQATSKSDNSREETKTRRQPRMGSTDTGDKDNDEDDDTHYRNNYNANQNQIDNNNYKRFASDSSTINAQSKDNTVNSKLIEATSETTLRSNLDSSLGTSTHHIDTTQRPTGFWARIRKGLEDLAMFIIQILD